MLHGQNEQLAGGLRRFPAHLTISKPNSNVTVNYLSIVLHQKFLGHKIVSYAINNRILNITFLVSSVCSLSDIIL